MTESVRLAHLVRSSRWQDLENLWPERILEDPDPAEAMEAIQAAARRKELPRLISLVRDHADVLVEAGRAGDAAHLLGDTMILGGSPGELGGPLYQAAEKAWGEEPFWEAFVELSGLRENASDLRGAWRAFRKLLAVQPDQVVYHAKGWGLGRIEGIDHAEREATVRFVTGRRDRFPFQTVIDIFEFLAEDDLRCLVVRDPEELARRIKEDPLDILRWIVAKNGGKATQAGIKLAMGTLEVEGPKFTAWWRRAKKAAESSEWFELSGPSNKVVVRLLDVAVDPADSIRRQLKRAKSLGEALTRTRALAAGEAKAPEVLDAALETIEELSMNDAWPMSQRLGTWIFLREMRGETPEALRKTFADAAALGASDDPSKRPAVWDLVHGVSGSRDQERCIELLREGYGEDWLDAVARHLHHAAPGMVRGLVDLLESEGRTDALIQHYKNLLARPTRNPDLLIRLAQKLENGNFEEQLPPRARRIQCLLQLAVYLERNASGNAILTRARARLSDVLTSGEEPLLRTLLADCDLENLRGLVIMLESGVDRAIERLFTHVAVEHSPDIFRGDERPFWETSGIWATKAGLARQQEELRILKEIKIPANSEAIGKAASYGDLSENSEWEAAIEEQRNLTTRAMELEATLANVHLLENAAIPNGVVSPGTRVRYRDLADRREHTIELLGPWDIEREGQISYLSPIGQGLLGCRVGDSATLELPSGSREVEVLEVTPLEF